MAWLALTVFGLIWVHAASRSGFSRGFFRDAREGAVVFWSIRLLVLSSLLGLSAGLIWPALFSPVMLPAHTPVRVTGLCLALSGSALFAWVTATLGQHFSTSLHLRTEHRLMTQGPYRRVRHPMYLAYQLSWLGFLLVTGNVIAASLGLVAFALAMWVRVEREEAMLAEAFGEQWQAYCQHTGRFIPRFYTVSK